MKKYMVIYYQNKKQEKHFINRKEALEFIEKLKENKIKLLNFYRYY